MGLIFTIYKFFTSKIGQVFAGLAAVAVLLISVRQSGARSEASRNETEKLKAEKATADRIDNADIPEDVTSSRARIAEFLHVTKHK